MPGLLAVIVILVIPLASNLLCNSTTWNLLYSFDNEYSASFVVVHDSPPMSVTHLLKYGRLTSSFLKDDKNTILASLDLISRDNKSVVNNCGPITFVPICISSPCSVLEKAGTKIPALLIRISSLSNLLYINVCI